MHRSGTSLVGQWFHECGLQLGDVLLGKGHSNKFGHFEDKDFLELHRDILNYNDLDYDIDSKIEINIGNYHKEKFKHLVQLKSSLHRQWGWKEPRTCLFISEWCQYLENDNYFIVFIDFREVVDSLLRREEKKFSRRRNIILKYIQTRKFRRNLASNGNHYLRTWIAYNQYLIDFITNKNPEYILVANHNLINNSEAVSQKIIRDWNYNLKKINIKEVFKEDSIKRKAKFTIDFDDQLLKTATNTYQKLMELETTFN